MFVSWAEAPAGVWHDAARKAPAIVAMAAHAWARPPGFEDEILLLPLLVIFSVLLAVLRS
ncbi:hypothetical protein [Streptosporangium sp. NPDC002721]|uniref:hypothetical protein n=1 Tax=Streptosporangium sp. NPDC002721 TaxID=3366188 RepID=UPI0036A1DDF0